MNPVIEKLRRQQKHTLYEIYKRETELTVSSLNEAVYKRELYALESINFQLGIELTRAEAYDKVSNTLRDL